MSKLEKQLTLAILLKYFFKHFFCEKKKIKIKERMFKFIYNYLLPYIVNTFAIGRVQFTLFLF